MNARIQHSATVDEAVSRVKLISPKIAASHLDIPAFLKLLATFSSAIVFTCIEALVVRFLSSLARAHARTHAIRAG